MAAIRPNYKRNTKPGAERNKFKPDVIESYEVYKDSSLLEFLIDVMPERKRTNIKELLSHNQIAVNGDPVRQFDLQLHIGDVVKANLTREFRVFYHRRIQLVYEDDDILVINKGYGLLSMGNDKVKEGTAYSILKEYVKWNDPKNKIFVVHRLDRDTTGLMMFAKTEEAKNIMQHNWNNMVLNRKYLAVVDGKFPEEEGVYRSYLTENSAHEVYSTDNPDEGQLAVTRYKRLSVHNGYSLIELELDTGRKNQIRVHMKEMGFPISGDKRYGGKPSPIHRLALHAQTLRFVHPISRKEMIFSTPVPSSFIRLMKKSPDY